ncbi:MAG: hypothetical protein CMH30_02595 [Micavibrio sp.]|nr:hypothetical protein [Micavibrio sp.]
MLLIGFYTYPKNIKYFSSLFPTILIKIAAMAQNMLILSIGNDLCAHALHYAKVDHKRNLKRRFTHFFIYA